MFNKPSCEEANASLEPSGENAGAPLCPGKEATTLREPEPKSCTTSCDFLFSKDTYAKRLPSGDQAGDIIGCELRFTINWL